MNTFAQTPIKLSVVVCTWNRSAMLTRCLESLANQTCPREDYEVLVVDNNSTDNTAESVAEFASRTNMNLRIVKETRQGLSHARNTGLKEATGKWVAFIDDDCIAKPGYVQSLISAFEETGAEAIAGKVTSIMPENLSTDLPKGFNAVKRLARLDLAPNRRAMANHEYALGGNLAVDKSLALSIGGFRPDLGYAGSSKVTGEDTEFWDKVRATGALAIWEPEAEVLHCVGPERFSKAEFRKAAFCYGLGSFARQLGEQRSVVRRLSAVARLSFQGFLIAVAWALAFWSPKTQFELELKLMERLGKIVAAFASADRRAR